MKVGTFDDIFRYNRKEYILLKFTEDIIYAAVILNEDWSKKLSSLYERRQAAGIRDLEARTIYAFVTLRTKGFEGRNAILRDTDKNGIRTIGIEPIGIRISDDDIEEIKKLIKTSPCVPEELKTDI